MSNLFKNNIKFHERIIKFKNKIKIKFLKIEKNFFLMFRIEFEWKMKINEKRYRQMTNNKVFLGPCECCQSNFVRILWGIKFFGKDYVFWLFYSTVLENFEL